MPTAATVRPDLLAGAMRDAVGRLSRRMRQNTNTLLSLGQLAALRSLERHGPMSPTELAAHEKVQPPSMTRIIARLEAEGYVVRTPHPADRRQIVVTVSDAGRRLLAEDRRRRDEWLAQQLRQLPAEEIAALQAALPVIEKLSRS